MVGDVRADHARHHLRVRTALRVRAVFNGGDIRDGWLTALLSVFGGCGNVLLGAACGCATLLSALQPMRSENPRERNAARLALAFVGTALLVVLWGQLSWR